MRNLWLAFANRINARSLRDRILILVAVLVVVSALGYTVILSGTLERKDKLRKQIQAKESEVGQTRVQVDSARKGAQDPDAASKLRLAQLKRLMEETDAGVAKKRDRLVAPERIPQLLEDMIAKQKSLQLVRINTVAAQSLLERKAGRPESDDEEGVNKPVKPSGGASPEKGAPAKPRRAEDVAGAPRGIYRHGVRIVVRGDYLELLAYLAALEKLPVQLFWKDLEIRVAEGGDAPIGQGAQPPRAAAVARTEMAVTLFTVSFDKIWLQV